MFGISKEVVHASTYPDVQKFSKKFQFKEHRKLKIYFTYELLSVIKFKYFNFLNAYFVYILNVNLKNSSIFVVAIDELQIYID